VLRFIRKLVEEYAQSLHAADTEKRLSSIAMVNQHPSKALPESGILEQHNQSQDFDQKCKEEGELHDALRHKVRLILRVIEREERGRHAILYESAATNQVATYHNRYPLERERRIPERIEHQNLPGSEQEVDPMASYNMDRDAEEMLYNMLMTRFSNVAIFGPDPPPLLDQPRLSSPPSYTSLDNVPGQSRPSHRLSLDKPLPPLELVDTLKARMHLARESERTSASNIYLWCSYSRVIWTIILES
jgi:hypothetical protein